jgi:hypothetical protein
MVPRDLQTIPEHSKSRADAARAHITGQVQTYIVSFSFYYNFYYAIDMLFHLFNDFW